MDDHKNLFEKAFFAYARANGFAADKGTTLLTVSGGVDSVVLTHLFHRAGWPFAIAHAHFGLRKEADTEEDFVRTLAQKYLVPFYTRSFATQAYAKAHHLSIQMAARVLRYAWFAHLVREHDFAAVATGHHHNDSIETFLRNIIKGTGIKGLQGIPLRYEKVVRPLLFATKEAIVTYAKAAQLSWVEDLSNKNVKYERNFLRHKVIPLLKKINPAFETTFETTLARLQQSGALFDHEVERLRTLAWRSEPPYHYIDMKKLVRLPWADIVLEAWLRPLGFDMTMIRPWRIARPQSGRKLYSTTHWLLVNRGEWVIGERSGAMLEVDSQIAAPKQDQISRQGGMAITLHRARGYIFTGKSHIAALDLRQLTFPLTLRRWQEGDFFYPLTTQKRYRKKVSDLLIDAKVSFHEKKNVKVLLSGDGEIAWVVGYQIDDRFKVTPDTKQIWQAAWHGKSV